MLFETTFRLGSMYRTSFEKAPSVEKQLFQRRVRAGRRRRKRMGVGGGGGGYNIVILVNIVEKNNICVFTLKFLAIDRMN
jgi:hypothetical protein